MLGLPLPNALHLQVLGAVLLAEDQPEPAVAVLRQALAGWYELGAVYDAARTRLHIATACRAVGDDDGAEMELAAAIPVFERLAAVRDAAAARAALPRTAHMSSGPPSSLTTREEEVLAFIAKGLTNRQIAGALTITEKTVATHVGHILAKLGLPSRAAATAYAYEHGLQ